MSPNPDRVTGYLHRIISDSPTRGSIRISKKPFPFVDILHPQTTKMGQFFEQIPEVSTSHSPTYRSIPRTDTKRQSLIQWVLDQKMFFVSTAPLSGSGHVNVSPKGGKYFGVLDRKTFWYQELTGSGNETISHIYEPGNNRVTIMLNAFEGPPRIMRLFGHGRVIENGAPGFDEFVKAQKVDCIPGTRSIIIVDIHQVGTSCGFSVPYYDFQDYRPILNDFFKKKAEREAAGHASDSMPK